MRFTPCAIQSWGGRYARIPGDTTVFHLRGAQGAPRISLDWDRRDRVIELVAATQPALERLMNAIAAGKQFLDGHSTSQRGQFVVNEFGQVLVPSSAGDGRRAVVGMIEGAMPFVNPEGGSPVDMADARGLSCGDVWPYPYVGTPYNLHSGSFIYFWRGETEQPPLQDEDLIARLRQIRPWGAVRFIVNPWGLVATKRPPTGAWTRDEQQWQPVFVGPIDPSRWFEAPVPGHSAMVSVDEVLEDEVGAR
jgi:hypothetical protein